MNLHLCPATDDDMQAMIELTRLAFAPVHDSFAQILGPQIFPMIYPDWDARHREGIESAFKNEKMHVWVAKIEGRVVGLIMWELFEKDQTGEVQFLAVHPDYQNRGIGSELNRLALENMREAGMQMATVGTGGDPSHAPARRCYEKAGYTALPAVRYYQKLS